MQLPVEAGVFQCRGDLPGDGRQQGHIFTGERLARFLASERQDRDRGVLRRTGNEVVKTRVAPELDLLRRKTTDRHRIVQCHDVACTEACAHP